jgi:hypothetical protein
MNTLKLNNDNHLQDIDNVIQIPNIKNYYVDKKYRKVCYKNKDGKWMYCKKIPNKPNYIAMYHNGQYTEVNETKIVNEVIPLTNNQINKKLFKEDKKLKERDARYKVGVDKGRMSTQTIGLPIQQKPPVQTVEVISNADKQKLKINQQKLNGIKNSIINNIPFAISVLNELGYEVIDKSEANQN